MTDLREIGPTYYFAPPRVFEQQLTKHHDPDGRCKSAETKGFLITSWPMPRKVGPRLLDGHQVGAVGPAEIPAGRNSGLWSAEEHAGVLQGARGLYGGRGDRAGDVRFLPRAGDQPEAALWADRGDGLHHASRKTAKCVPIPWAVPTPGVELKIAESGEVFYRGPGAFVEYYKNAESTASTKDAEGWVATGDAGFIEEGTGHLRIIDRAKDVGKLADGSLFAPKYVENKLKFFPDILEAVVFGNGRDRPAPSSTST